MILSPEKFRAKMDKWATKTNEKVASGLEKSIKLIVRDAKQKHMTGPRMPVGVGSITNPTIDSKGRMRSMISGKVKKIGLKGITAEVRSSNPLSRILHDGGTVFAKKNPFVFKLPNQDRTIATEQIKFPKRPFLNAPVKKRRITTLRIIKRFWTKGL